ncbi:Rrf2 family transcriptional regulator [Devosia neptuniae]|jgi:Rrf2 family protein|uniref:RrF2 family transcriptional regulator n=1 Tax=Devosia TaxID=46913 RepID=UPI0022AE63D3|nr:Rrf2 family transcriptional regulator [Devosia neptuniae]MCZ4347740.1 Rrf2 family transcriptional regulator [Devosia neptuniae]|tara:strand:- start:4269 stop:4727 length:459 start_codon:yes stop_codon:yes gene_type:complete
MKRSSRLSLALHALVHLYHQPDTAMTSATLAQCLMTNPVVVRRVLGELREAGIVSAAKGREGGWRLAQPADQISLQSIHVAMGESLLIRTQSDPGDEHCAIVRAVDGVMGEFIADAEALLAARLERVSLDDIARQAGPYPLHPPHGENAHAQ